MGKTTNADSALSIKRKMASVEVLCTGNADPENPSSESNPNLTLSTVQVPAIVSTLNVMPS